MAFKVFNLESGRSMAQGLQWGSDDLLVLPAINAGEVGTGKFGDRQSTVMKFRMEDIDNAETIPAGSVFTLAQFQTRASDVGTNSLAVVANLLKRDGTWDKPNTDSVWRAIDQSRLDKEIDILFSVTGTLGNFSTEIAPPVAGVLPLPFGGLTSEISQMGQSILRPSGSLGAVVSCRIRMNRVGDDTGTLVMDIYSTKSPNGSDHRPATLIATSDLKDISLISTSALGTNAQFNFTSEPWSMAVGDYVVGVVRVVSPMAADAILNFCSAKDPTFGGPFSYADGNLSRFENSDGWGSKNYQLNEELPLLLLSSGLTHFPNQDQIDGGGFVGFVAPNFLVVGTYYVWLDVNPNTLRNLLTNLVAQSDYTPGDPIGMIISTPAAVGGTNNNRLWDDARLVLDWTPPILGKVEFDGIIEEAVAMDTSIEKAVIVETQIEPAVYFQSRIEPAVLMEAKIEPAVRISVGIC